MKSLLSYKSHPDKNLENHLKTVADVCKKTIQRKSLNLWLGKKVIEDISYLIGLCHDFGKFTSYFQDYIREKDEYRKKRLKNRPETKHGLISAVFAYFVVRDYLKEKDLTNQEQYNLLPIIAYLIVKKHHGNLGNVVDEILELREPDKKDVLKRQLDSITVADLGGLYATVNLKTFCQNLASTLDEIRKKKREIKRTLGEEESPRIYLLSQFLYSVLLNSDKQDASGIFINQDDHEIDPGLVDKYITSKGFDDPQNEMNSIRNDIYNDAISTIESLDLNNKIYSLNVPTGTGKTLTSFSFALKLREKIKKERGVTPKVIYSLPFLSIIDQNYDVFEDVFKEVNGKSPPSSILLKHHHLAELSYTLKDDEFEPPESQFLIEGWNSEVVVTTFYQFFHTLISNRNRALRKFHNIVNSIVILDEVQSIPHKYWLLIKEVLSTLAENFNTYFIFATATQPLIFHSNELIELVPDKKDYFEHFDRVRLIPSLKPLHIEDFKKLAEDEIQNQRDKDFLFVLNTINASKEVFEHLNSMGLKDSNLYYLSTNITPKERLERIKAIKKDTKRKIIVSTQLIEAGVDIDVDVVLRDFAPLDSINQVAGRCNRNFTNIEKGEVKLFVLKDDRKKFYNYIYSSEGAFLIDQTMEILEPCAFIDEKEFLSLSDQYFQRVKELGPDDRSILDNAITLQFKDLGDLQLIKEDYKKLDVFVEIDEDAKSIWQKYCEIKESSKNPIEKMNEFLKIKKQFYDYVISVPEQKAKIDIDEDLGIGYIPMEELEERYSPQTGFIPYESGGVAFC